jgi:FkbM family methyltransferase
MRGGSAVRRLSRSIASAIPEAVKRPIRPVYDRLLGVARPPEPDSAPAPQRPAVALGTFGGFEIMYRPGTADERVLAHSFDADIFLTGMPEYRPGEADVVVEVGAHIGTFAVLIASRVPRGRVYAVEACGESYALCRANAALNRLDHVDVSHLALADRAGTCTLFYGPGNWDHSTVASWSGEGETVPSDTLESFMSAKAIDRCDFMKFNCEGAEFPILLSTPLHVLERVSMMLVLYHCDLYRERSEEALLEHLGRAGFRTEVRERTERRGWIIATRRAARTPSTGSLE